MKEPSDCKIAKWPFLLSGVALLVVSAILAARPAHAITTVEIFLATASVALGAVLACLPFVLEYRAVNKWIELDSLGAVAEQLQDLKKFSAQISEATGQWAMVQETTKGHADKAIAAAGKIAERMAVEIHEFNEFQARINDSEKVALRLEVDKLRRVEGEWLQVLARILDHIFALHAAAACSGQPEIAGQIANFQHACRDTARRVGLVPFEAEPGETFNAEKHRVQGVENPAADAIVGETLAPGISFQGRLLRPALIRLQAPATPAAEPGVVEEKSAAPESESGQLTLEAD